MNEFNINDCERPISNLPPQDRLLYYSGQIKEDSIRTTILIWMNQLQMSDSMRAALLSKFVDKYNAKGPSKDLTAARFFSAFQQTLREGNPIDTAGVQESYESTTLVAPGEKYEYVEHGGSSQLVTLAHFTQSGERQTLYFLQDPTNLLHYTPVTPTENIPDLPMNRHIQMINFSQANDA